MRLIAKTLFAVLFAGFLLNPNPVAFAAGTAAERLIQDWSKTLGKIETSLKRTDLPESDLEKIRGQLVDIRKEARKLRARHKPELEALEQQLKKLGPKPKEGEEPEGIAKTRKEQTALLETQKSLFNGVELVILRTSQLEGLASEIQRRHFLGNLLSRTKSALNPFIWVEAAAYLPDFSTRIRLLVEGWLRDAGETTGNRKLLFIALTLVLSLLVAFPFRYWTQSKARPMMDSDEPAYARRITVAALTAAADILPPLAGAWLFYWALYLTGVLNLRMDRIVLAAVIAISAFVLIRGVARAILSPFAPRWRLGVLPDASAQRIYSLVTLAALVFGMDYFSTRLSSVLFLDLPLTIAQSVISGASIAVLLALILKTPLGILSELEIPPERAKFIWLRRMRSLLWLLVFAIVFTLSAGYIALGRFLAIQSVTTGLLVISFYVLHLLADETLVVRLHPDRATGKFLQNIFALSSRAVERFGLALATLIDISLVLIGIPLVILQWGLKWEDVRGWITAAFFGVELGNIHISLSSVLTGLAVFALGFLLTRLFQKWLDTRLLSRTQLDIGVRNSIRTGSGYAGIMLAALLAMTYGGVDFTGIAVVAGALSVGIGFGLRSIVNNFVSGLILLVERPFKAGDWVVVGSDEGYVKKIKVRSTEIETFNRASVIVPNADLITKPVTNWTLKSKLGRIIITIGVSYDSDPDQVEKILLTCAKSIEIVETDPAPYVLFTDFGDNALIFELRAYIKDVSKSLSTASQLRFSIFRALKAADIAIPFPQRDIHIISQPEPKGEAV
jgi:small-conductance mechanosensitive channel